MERPKLLAANYRTLGASGSGSHVQILRASECCSIARSAHLSDVPFPCNAKLDICSAPVSLVLSHANAQSAKSQRRKRDDREIRLSAAWQRLRLSTPLRKRPRSLYNPHHAVLPLYAHPRPLHTPSPFHIVPWRRQTALTCPPLPPPWTDVAHCADTGRTRHSTAHRTERLERPSSSISSSL
jgi:hypothetical protein